MSMLQGYGSKVECLESFLSKFIFSHLLMEQNMSLLVSFGLEHLPPLIALGEASGWATALSAGVSDFGSFSQFQALKTNSCSVPNG